MNSQTYKLQFLGGGCGLAPWGLRFPWSFLIAFTIVSFKFYNERFTEVTNVK